LKAGSLKTPSRSLGSDSFTSQKNAKFSSKDTLKSGVLLARCSSLENLSIFSPLVIQNEHFKANSRMY
jgi:hypothetical protein